MCIFNLIQFIYLVKHILMNAWSVLTAWSPTSTSQSVHLNWSQHCNAVGTFNVSWCALCKKQSRNTREEEQLGAVKKKKKRRGGRVVGEGKRVMWGCASTRNQLSKRLKKKRGGGLNTSQGGAAESLHVLFSQWNSHYTHPLRVKGAALRSPLKSLGTNATPEYRPN